MRRLLLHFRRCTSFLSFASFLLLFSNSAYGRTTARTEKYSWMETTIVYSDNDVMENIRANNMANLRNGHNYGTVADTTGAVPPMQSGKRVMALLSNARGQKVLLQEEEVLTFSKRALPDSSRSSSTLIIDVIPHKTYQSMEGFGYALTQGAAEEISRLSPTEQDKLLHELFGPSQKGGNNISLVRISIGASDLSTSLYTYNDTPNDYDMVNFTLSGPDLTFVIPLLKRIQQINPSVKILSTPWTPPIWMKHNNDWVGGTLREEAYDAYARYFVRYVQEMAKKNISIWAITTQNEPENDQNTPSMMMSADAQLSFVHRHLGPSLESAGLDTKIMAWDHNCDNPDYAIQVANESHYVHGSAFHLYGGDISTMSTVKEATNKDVYFTEQWTGKNGDFDGDFGWHITLVVVGSIRNWSRSVIEWTLATVPADKTLACPGCLGAITVNQDGQGYQRHVSFYIIGQIAKYVNPGAVRIDTNDLHDEQIHNVAVKNPDNTIVLLVYNSAPAARTFTVKVHSETFEYSLDGRSAVTFKWRGK